eukprot:7391022-Prymnesium_polylepis.3
MRVSSAGFTNSGNGHVHTMLLRTVPATGCMLQAPVVCEEQKCVVPGTVSPHATGESLRNATGDASMDSSHPGSAVKEMLRSST